MGYFNSTMKDAEETPNAARICFMPNYQDRITEERLRIHSQCGRTNRRQLERQPKVIQYLPDGA